MTLAPERYVGCETSDSPGSGTDLLGPQHYLDQDEMFRVAIDEFVALVLTRMNTPGSAAETAA
jgi:hypothetical protein